MMKLIVTKILFIKLLGRKLQWIVHNIGSSSRQDPPRIRLYDCSFPNLQLHFELCGLMSLIRCEFKGEWTFLELSLKKSQYEPDINEETLENFNVNKSQNTIEIIQTRMDDIRHLDIYTDNVARQLKMENVYLHVYDGFIIDSGVKKRNDCSSVSMFELDVNNCTIEARVGTF